jgi:hypothetical protein
VLAADIHRLRAALLLLQHPGALFFSKPRGSRLRERQIWRKVRVSGQSTELIRLVACTHT